jgi:hypothetical protein
VQGNYIGTDAYGEAPVRNGGLAPVVVISSAGAGNVIGGDAPGAGNLICSDVPALAIAGATGTVSAANRVMSTAALLAL